MNLKVQGTKLCASYQLKKACEIALSTITAWPLNHPFPKTVTVMAYAAEAVALLKETRSHLCPEI